MMHNFRHPGTPAGFHPPARRGFTLIELLVVIAIIAILAAILFPVFAKAREKARQTACLSNMNQIGKAIEMYKSDYDQFYVPITIPNGASNRSWPSLIYSYVGSQDVFVCPSASDQPKSTDLTYWGDTKQSVGVTEDSTVDPTKVCNYGGGQPIVGGDGSSLDTWIDGTQSTLVHRLSYSLNGLPDAAGTWSTALPGITHPGGVWGNNSGTGGADPVTNLHKSGFVDTKTSLGLNEAKVDNAAATIYIIDGQDALSAGGGANCYPANAMRAMQSETKLDYSHKAGQSLKPAARHSDGFNALYGDSHVHWRPAGRTTPCDWTIQEDTCP